MAFLSPVSLYGSYLNRSFKSAGLRRQSITIDGGDTTLYFWISTTTTTLAKPTVILIHGFGPEPKWQWSHQIKPLSRQFRLVVPDLVFFGESTTKSASRSEIFQAECVVKLLDQIGVDRFYPVGTSYGGFVAYHVGRICGPERVAKVVIASSNVLIKEGDNRELMEIAGVNDMEELMLPKTPEMMRMLVKLVMFRYPRWLPDFLLNDMIHTFYSDNREEKVQLIKNITLEKSDGFQQLPQEILLVWGDHDHLFPLEKAREIKKKIAKKVTLEVIKNTSHLPQSENPRRFNAVVKDFLSLCD